MGALGLYPNPLSHRTLALYADSPCMEEEEVISDETDMA
jgi:hypothetical protein